MLLFVAALVAATGASGAWCAGEILAGHAQAWRSSGRRIAGVSVLFAAVLGVAVWLRFSVVPAHHAMYLDEQWYAEAACNLARFGRPLLCQETWSGRVCEPYEKALGWPVFLAPWALLTGCYPSVPIQINRVLGTMAVLLVAVAARLAGARWWHCAIAAAMLAIHPIHVAWSATGETTVAAAVTLLAGVCGALLYVRSGRWCGAALAISSLGLSTAIRPELLVPTLATAVIVAFTAPTALSQRLWVAGATGVVGAAAAASATQLWAMNKSMSGGAFFALNNIPGNVALLTGTESLPIHGIVVLVALAGAAVMARHQRRAASWLLIGAALTAALVVLAFDRFQQRMLLAATVCLLPLCAFALDVHSTIPTAGRWRATLPPLAAAILVVLFGWLWWDALPLASVWTEVQMLETRMTSRVARLPLAADSLVITEQPAVLAAAGITRVMATEQALQNENQLSQLVNAERTVYFLCDMYCEPGFAGAASPPLCNRMFERFALSPVAKETLNSRTYVLYRVSGPAGSSSSTSRECPTSLHPSIDE